MRTHGLNFLHLSAFLVLALSAFACGQEKAEPSELTESQCNYSRWTNCLIELDQISYRPGDTDLKNMAEYNRKRSECRRYECR